MKLDVKKVLTGGEFKVAIEFKAYEVFEEGLMEDFGVPELNIPVSTWGGTFAKEGNALKVDFIQKDKPNGNCNIDIEKEIVVKIDNTFKVDFAVKINDIEENSINEVLDSVVKVAEAKCMLFVEVIRQEAKKEMDRLREMKTDFEAIVKNPEVIKI